MTKKVLQLVGSCNECPRKSYYSGGRSECTETGSLLPYNDGDRIPDWCPLANYPSAAMERQRDQITALESQLAAFDLGTVREAADAIQLWTGHDSIPNLRSRFGSEWWGPVKKIEQALRKMLPAAQ